MISVIMLTFNREKLVGRAIESILAQSYGNFELIIINNGSSDNSSIVAKSYAKKDGRIKVIDLEKGNIGRGRNVGLDTATGEYICFVDDDDYCSEDYLEFLLSLSKENDCDMAICGAYDKIFEEEKVMTTEEALIELMWRKKYNVAFPCKLYKATMFDGIRFSTIAKYDDIELMPRIISRANKVIYNGSPKYTFERHENNNSAWTTDHSLINATILDEYLTVYKDRTKWLIENYPDNEILWKYFRWSFMISMYEKVLRLDIHECENQKQEIFKELLDHKKEFLNCGFVLEFEKEWIKRLII